MSEIYGLLDKLEPIKQEQQQMRPLSALYYWPLALAALLCFGYLLSLHFSFLLPTKNVNTKKHADMNKDDINAMGGK
jgi:Ca-activated chloride channel family protein